MQDILIVEDSPIERNRLEGLFCGAGFSVSAAESVQEAEALLESSQFRLAVLDVGLGDKSGSYLFESLVRSGEISFIVIFTGNPSVHLKQRFLDAGAVSYVAKASTAASSENFLHLVYSLLGAPAVAERE